MANTKAVKLIADGKTIEEARFQAREDSAVRDIQRTDKLVARKSRRQQLPTRCLRLRLANASGISREVSLFLRRCKKIKLVIRSEKDKTNQKRYHTRICHS